LYGADGRLALQYDKVHICGFTDGAETALQGGDGFVCADIALGGETVRVGAMICFDREFPEAGRWKTASPSRCAITRRRNTMAAAV
ncbi:hypothetical protein C3E98_041340, partial [Pseudomonas sp. MWU13-2625]